MLLCKILHFDHRIDVVFAFPHLAETAGLTVQPDPPWQRAPSRAHAQLLLCVQLGLSFGQGPRSLACTAGPETA